MKNTIYSVFENIAKRQADKPAIIENARTVTFGELSDLIDIIAESFPRGVKSVGIVMNRRAEMIAAIFAVLKCGARYVPAEPNFPKGRIRFMMKESEADLVLTDKAYADKLSGFSAVIADCSVCGIEKPSRALSDLSEEDSPAYVLYTSGTTGRPKGVCVTNKNVCHYARAFAEEFRPTSADVMLQYSVCSFDIFVEEVFASLLNGAAIAIPSDEDKRSIGALMDFVRRHGVTIISGFPYLLAEMNHLDSIPSSLRLLISGGDVLRKTYITDLIGKAEIYNTYGPSETTVCASYFKCAEDNALHDGTYPIGKAVKGARLFIADKCGKSLPQGETGEICICGDGVSLGYIGGREQENKAFVYSKEDGMTYRSGDLGYVLPDGNIAFLRRKDTQVMIYGKRVETAEVEARLYRCRGVNQALVRAYTDDNGLPYMIAYIVPSVDTLRISEIKKELAEHLAEFMIPEFIIKMPSIPINDNGKPDTDMKELENSNRDYFARELSSGGHVACFAYDGGDAIGCGGLCLQRELPSPDNPSGRAAYLMNIFVDPERRRIGAGRAIVEWLVRYAKKSGITKIYLESTDGAKALYSSVGFDEIKNYMILNIDGNAQF